MEEVKVGLVGLGTVGSGVYELIAQNGEFIAQKTGLRLTVKKILVRDLAKPRPVSSPPELLTTQAEEIFGDPEIKIVCELLGGIEPAKTYILEALRAGKAVVTANKAVLAEHGEEVFRTAQETGQALFFEAAVGGGVPIIKTLRESLSANRIQNLTAIVNGTCNYILTRMLEEGRPLPEVVAEAQKLGLAEADPSLDLSGLDSAHKIAILATLTQGSYISSEKVYVEGIEGLEPLDLAFAQELGFVTKLLALACLKEGGLEIRVHPTLVPQGHMLASVRLAYNAFLLKGDFVGQVLLYGLGAGAKPTASAVVADLLDAARQLQSGTSPPPLLYRASSPALIPMEEVVSRYYFRFSALDRPGVLSKIAGILGQHQISIASVIQKERREGEAVPIVMLTHEAREKAVRQALKEIDQLEVVAAPTKLLRILES